LIIAKALEKDREVRCQTASEMRADLKRVQRRIESGAAASEAPAAGPPSRTVVYVAMATLALAATIAAAWRLWSAPPRPAVQTAWTQITNLPDSVTQPALSADGRMVTFIRGPSTFVGQGQIYVKMLPDGEPTQLTRDGVSKMSP